MFKCLTLIFIMAVSSISFAGEHPFIQSFLAKGKMELEDKHQIDASMTRYQLRDKKRNKSIELFITSTGLVVFGQVYDITGRQLNVLQASVKDTFKGDTVTKVGNTLPYVEMGGGKKVLNIYFDPSCGPCKKLYSSVTRSIQADKYNIRWWPVAVITEQSYPIAEAIIGAEDPVQALHNYMSSRNIDRIKNMDAKQNVWTNNNNFKKYGHTGTPSGFITNDDGERILLSSSTLFSMFML